MEPTLDELKKAPDYVKIHTACLVLQRLAGANSRNNLNPDHDIIYLCFDLPSDEMTEEDYKTLEACDVAYNEDLGLWYRHTSC